MMSVGQKRSIDSKDLRITFPFSGKIFELSVYVFMWVVYINNKLTLLGFLETAMVFEWSVKWTTGFYACGGLSIINMGLPSLPSKAKACSHGIPFSLSHKLEFLFFFKKDFMYLFLERREGKEKEREKHQCVVASCAPPTGDLTHNPGMWPVWESNQWPFGWEPSLSPLSYTSQGTS